VNTLWVDLDESLVKPSKVEWARHNSRRLLGVKPYNRRRKLGQARREGGGRRRIQRHTIAVDIKTGRVVSMDVSSEKWATESG
jgi:hypothetical protein